ncbi:MAG: hypothetical protein A3F09_06125 [Chlamydiae bacterium RIFCSPHIGHO2_12_FULL_49_11]|nr:MAG: hypothetical protein A3F09_06125 [Chlamydiae bacterium RIFCSPHIGHO2_12_FULL_49_11]
MTENPRPIAPSQDNIFFRMFKRGLDAINTSIGPLAFERIRMETWAGTARVQHRYYRMLMPMFTLKKIFDSRGFIDGSSIAHPILNPYNKAVDEMHAIFRTSTDFDCRIDYRKTWYSFYQKMHKVAQRMKLYEPSSPPDEGREKIQSKFETMRDALYADPLIAGKEDAIGAIRYLFEELSDEGKFSIVRANMQGPTRSAGSKAMVSVLTQCLSEAGFEPLNLTATDKFLLDLKEALYLQLILKSVPKASPNPIIQLQEAILEFEKKVGHYENIVVRIFKKGLDAINMCIGPLAFDRIRTESLVHNAHRQRKYYHVLRQFKTLPLPKELSPDSQKDDLERQFSLIMSYNHAMKELGKANSEGFDSRVDYRKIWRSVYDRMFKIAEFFREYHPLYFSDTTRQFFNNPEREDAPEALQQYINANSELRLQIHIQRVLDVQFRMTREEQTIPKSMQELRKAICLFSYQLYYNSNLTSYVNETFRMYLPGEEAALSAGNMGSRLVRGAKKVQCLPDSYHKATLALLHQKRRGEFDRRDALREGNSPTVRQEQTWSAGKVRYVRHPTPTVEGGALNPLYRMAVIHADRHDIATLQVVHMQNSGHEEAKVQTCLRYGHEARDQRLHVLLQPLGTALYKLQGKWEKKGLSDLLKHLVGEYMNASSTHYRMPLSRSDSIESKLRQLQQLLYEKFKSEWDAAQEDRKHRKRLWGVIQNLFYAVQRDIIQDAILQSGAKTVNLVTHCKDFIDRGVQQAAISDMVHLMLLNGVDESAYVSEALKHALVPAIWVRRGHILPDRSRLVKEFTDMTDILRPIVKDIYKELQLELRAVEWAGK